MKSAFMVVVAASLLGLAACNGENSNQPDGASQGNESVAPQSSAPSDGAPAVGDTDTTQSSAPTAQ
ncbi:hypothetical protein FIV00_20375 [Labrenzia sp. THAF82]|uniref:hypothetical protein n=1 Tax=Labrenzia sp. THAF82 TaxID=2587861 RepID=UPI0012684211|nr:hypothetical protein [Labrenzia sp. THAF82]QFT32858.1 hypothetical protein FIV00_20375 [Labrenzia sp. THAF82]